LVDLRQCDELIDRRIEILDRLRVGHVVADVTTVECGLIRVLVEEIRRDADEAIARKARRQVARVLYQAVALVHQHDCGQGTVRCRHRKKGRKAAVAAHGFGGDIGHRRYG
jgi:hypothetical protein